MPVLDSHRVYVCRVHLLSRIYPVVIVRSEMKITREWAMPNRWTFAIPPIANLIGKYVGNGKGWIDPFAGKNSPAEITNDIDARNCAAYHMEAHEFVDTLPGIYRGVIFDPPYSLEQCKRSYEDVGRKFTMQDGQVCGRWSELKHKISRKLEINAIAICCGWNSEGFGKGRGFELEEILLVAHGSGHNDTIVTVERKIQHYMEFSL